jgi:hypothetical protein
MPTRSLRCASNACLVATALPAGVRVTDSSGAAVLFTTDAWRHLVAGLKAHKLTKEIA